MNYQGIHGDEFVYAVYNVNFLVIDQANIAAVSELIYVKNLGENNHKTMSFIELSVR